MFESETIKIVESVDEDGDVQRQLFLGPPFQWPQGAIKTARPKYHVNEFTRNLTYGALCVSGEIANALFLGLGAGVTIQAVRDLAPLANVDIVDLNPELFAISNDLFFRIDSENVKRYPQDAYAFIKNVNKTYDYVCCDIWGKGLEAPEFLIKDEFWTCVRSITSLGGVFSINTQRFLHKQIAEALVKKFRFVFSLSGFNCSLLATNSRPKSTSDEDIAKDMLSKNIDIKFIFDNAMLMTSTSSKSLFDAP